MKIKRIKATYVSRIFKYYFNDLFTTSFGTEVERHIFYTSNFPDIIYVFMCD